jgi:hypothetical protein
MQARKEAVEEAARKRRAAKATKGARKKAKADALALQAKQRKLAKARLKFSPSRER